MGRRRAPAVTGTSRGSWAAAGVLAFVLGTGCGGGESPQHVSLPPPSADFAITISPSAVTVNQGTTNSAIQITVQPANGFSAAVQVTLSGLPAGVTTSPQSPFEVQSGASAMLLVGAASSAATGTTTISAQGTSGALTHTANLKLTVQSGTLPASRTTFVRTDSIASLDDPAGEPHHRHMAYDPANRHLFVANAAANRVEVLSTVDGSHVAAIDASGASSADLSADGKTVWVGTVTGQILGIDTNTLRPNSISLIRALTPVPNTVFDRPEEVVALANGQALVRLRQGASAESLLALWDPVSNSLTNLTAAAPQLFQSGAGVMGRSGDHTRVLVAANDSSGAAAVFSGNGTLAVGPKTLGAGIVQYAAGNLDGSKFAAILGQAGQQVVLLDSALNVVASRPTSGTRGLVFSRDSGSLYLAELQSGSAVITALAATDLHPLGQIADLNLQGVFTEIEESDETALVFGMGNRGTTVLDAAQPASLQFPLPAMSAVPAVLPGGGGNAGGVLTTLSGANFSSNATILFGGQAATISAGGSLTQVQATSPASTSNGAVNVSAYFSNGAVAIAPDGFSYGPQILEVLPNAGNASGGDNVAIYGYGFGEDAGKITVKFGSASAVTQKVEDLAAIAPTLGLGASYPFPLQRVTVTAPAGSDGAVDLTLSAPSGSTREQRGFHYLQSSQAFAKPGFYKFVAYDRKRQWIYLSNIDHVDVFDLQAGNYRPGILPPGGPPPNALIREAALTPDASQLAIADFGAQSVYLMNPDTAAGSKVFVGGVAGDSNSGPVRIAATSSQNLFIGLTGFSGGASACSTCLQQMNLGSSPVSVESAPQPEVSLLTSSPLLDASADGATAYFSFASAPGQPVAGWSASTPLEFATAQTGAAASDFAVSADGNTLASRIENVVEVRDQSFGLRSVTQWTERQGIPQRTLVLGLALHPSGALVYVPFLTGPAPVSAPFTGLQGGVDIMDAHTGRLRLRVMLPEPLAMLAADVDALQGKFLTIDENGRRLFALTASGLSVVQLDSVPLGIGTLNPPNGSVSGGITVTVRGSGFQTGATASIGGIAAATSFMDMNTLQFKLPAIPAGLQRLTVCNPNAECVSLDGAFTAN